MTISETFNHQTAVAISELRQHCSDHIKFLDVIHFVEITKLRFGFFDAFSQNCLCCFSLTWLKIYHHQRVQSKGKAIQ